MKLPPHFTYWKNTQLAYLDCNQSYLEWLGLESPKDLIGKTDAELNLQKPTFPEGDDILLSGHPFFSELSFTDSTGEKFHFSIQKYPQFNFSNELIGLFCSIIETKQIQMSTQTSQISTKKQNHTLTFSSENLENIIAAIGFIGLFQ